MTGWHAPQVYVTRRLIRRHDRDQLQHAGDVGAYLNTHLLQVALAVVMAIAFGGLIALILGDWLLFPLAAGIHGLATGTGAFIVTRMSHRRSPRSLTRTRSLTGVRPLI